MSYPSTEQWSSYGEWVRVNDLHNQSDLINDKIRDLEAKIIDLQNRIIDLEKEKDMWEKQARI